MPDDTLTLEMAPVLEEQLDEVALTHISSTAKPDLKFIMPLNSGLLLCFKILAGSEIYEIWKRKITAEDTFTKIANISTYLSNKKARAVYSEILLKIGIANLTGIGVWVDSNIEKNCVYEYKIRAITHPTSEDWSLIETVTTSRIMLTADMLTSIWETASSSGLSLLEEISRRIFGVSSYGWILGVLNESVDFFAPDETILEQLRSAEGIVVPVSIQEFVREVQRSVSSYSICNVIEKIANELGSIDATTLQLLLRIISENRTVDMADVLNVRTETAEGTIPLGDSTVLSTEEGGGGGEEEVAEVFRVSEDIFAEPSSEVTEVSTEPIRTTAPPTIEIPAVETQKITVITEASPDKVDIINPIGIGDLFSTIRLSTLTTNKILPTTSTISAVTLPPTLPSTIVEPDTTIVNADIAITPTLLTTTIIRR